MSYKPDPRTNDPKHARGDQLLGWALLEHIATGGVTWTPALEQVVYKHSGGAGPMERQHRNQWGEATNIPAMARSLRALRGEPGAADSVHQDYLDQRDHGQPAEFQLHHRGEVEDLSIGYLVYQLLARLALYLAPEMPDALRMEVGRSIRRDVVLAALCLTPRGRIAMACGRVRAEPGIHHQEHGAERSREARGGERNVEAEFFVSTMLGIADPVLDGVNLKNIERGGWPLVQIAQTETSLPGALFRPEEISALHTWIAGQVHTALLPMLSEIRLAEEFRVVRWDGGHVAWWPVIHSYNHVQPLAAAVGERLTFAVVGRASAMCDRPGRDLWEIPGLGMVQLPVSDARVEAVSFGGGPPWVNGTEVRVADPGPPGLAAGRRPGMVGVQPPTPKPEPPQEPPPEEPGRPLPREVTPKDVADHAAESAAIRAEAQRVILTKTDLLDRLRRATNRSDWHVVVAAMAAVDQGLTDDPALRDAVAAFRRALGDAR